MSDVFNEMSKVTMKPVVNYTVLPISLISSLNFTFFFFFFYSEILKYSTASKPRLDVAGLPEYPLYRKHLT